MIDASELRIGNMLLMEGRHYVKVLSIDIDRFLYQDPRTPHYGTYCYYPNNPYSYLTQCSPIPLTLELLIKCGFELTSKHSYWNFRNEIGFVISMWMEDRPMAGWEKKGVCYWGGSYVEITYLHELQNLHFIICKKELIFCGW